MRWLIVVLVGCSAKTQAPADPVAVVPVPDDAVLQLPPPEHDPETVVQMHTWLQLAEAARSQVTAGDLDAARASAASMAAAPPVDALPPGWRPFAADLLAEATALSQATTATSAGAHLGQMSVACGTCHTEAHVTDQVALVAFPHEMNNEDARMDNHQWASDWMWFGLVTADDQAYRLGAQAFVDTELPPFPEGVDEAVGAEMTERVGTLATHAASATDVAGRAQRYGELLATCAECHATFAAVP